MSFIQAHCGKEGAQQQLDSCGGKYPVLREHMATIQNTSGS
jgi:hypothetical protein